MTGQATMLQRQLEDEFSESSEEALTYDKMDHDAVNQAFVDEFLAAVESQGLGPRLHDGVNPLTLVDVGTGTARIPINLARRPLFVKPIVVDASEAMLKLAKLNIYASGLQANIVLKQANAHELPFDDQQFDALMSNSLIHHIPKPSAVFAEMLRVLKPGGLIFVRDLARPESTEGVEELVAKHAAEETEEAQQLFRQSLQAALTVDEVASMLKEQGVDPGLVTMSSDRHWTIAGLVKPV
ncbi:class I SAM-dependent methyltransferase [Stratiformator vulcanicus]|uniref:Demethylrebeccamycin-D-glucose O-methyltransferase n=1 Tax=Stratiformator vulcanicus TaxID=2527980 RepID=A0A517R547_9PLAN|nr:methyltransferase domain-containing protein [Stratiformator vulcanicus]QDT38970.1 Demethylrebeccamycin-D-glucose O-methyltransferase [Stratiformator vulcanicus]